MITNSGPRSGGLIMCMVTGIWFVVVQGWRGFLRPPLDLGRRTVAKSEIRMPKSEGIQKLEIRNESKRKRMINNRPW